jgi:ABC-type multidrug transport system fused ATPase/permease subunit
MMTDLKQLCWPVSKIGEAIQSIARRSGLAPVVARAPDPPGTLAPVAGESLARWIEKTSCLLGLEAEPVVSPYAEADRFVRNAGPALLRLPGESCFLALIAARRGAALILAPDLRVHRVKLKLIQAALCREIEAGVAAKVDRLLVKAGVPGRRQAKARGAILREQIGHIWIRDCWLLRKPPSASFIEQARQSRLPRLLLTIAVAHGFQYLLILASWWLIGQGVLEGRRDYGWLFAWAILLLTAVPFRVLAAWSQGQFSIGAGTLLKQRLLYGSLRMDPEEIKHQGAGQILGRVIESSAVESLALNGGFLCLIAMIELILAGAVLCAGAGGFPHALLLICWSAIAAAIGWWYFNRRRNWTEARLDMTNDLVERMVGHRTRLAQELREQWHTGEDQSVERYVQESAAMDKIAMMQTGLARGWIVAGLGALAPVFVSGTISPVLFAISLGGILLASRAMVKLITGLSSYACAAIAWKQIAPLFRAAANREEITATSLLLDSEEVKASDGETLLEACDIVFRYRKGGEAVLRGCNLRICAGDRLLLEGRSGGGKSTLASLLAGLRTPESGLLLLGGLDHKTLGASGWRERIASAPQFHENHVLTATLAFNLLMGRRWPPRPEDLEEAETICRELGLGDLLERMPAGMMQMVGETGWQLSHGERSRLYMARALLGDADLIILDESFASLDPQTLRQCLRAVMDRARTLMVIAHP